jgi:hypothetical protein
VTSIGSVSLPARNRPWPLWLTRPQLDAALAAAQVRRQRLQFVRVHHDRGLRPRQPHADRHNAFEIGPRRVELETQRVMAGHDLFRQPARGLREIEARLRCQQRRCQQQHAAQHTQAGGPARRPRRYAHRRPPLRGSARARF